MEGFKKWLSSFTEGSSWPSELNSEFRQFAVTFLMMCFWMMAAALLLYYSSDIQAAFASVDILPGEDVTDKLKAAGTLLQILDTGLFKWGARLFAGICIMSSAWSLKEQRFGIAIICVIGAIIFGTAPRWVKNIFEIGGNESIFSHLEHRTEDPIRSYVLLIQTKKEEVATNA